MRFCWYGVEGGKSLSAAEVKKIYEIITTGKLMVCTVPKRAITGIAPVRGTEL